MFFRTMIGAVVLSACGTPGPALVEERRKLAGREEVSRLLGFSISQVVETMQGSAELTWGEPREFVVFEPSASTTNLTWSLTLPETHEVIEVDVECDRGRFATNGPTCDDRLEERLILTLDSADGALSERIPIVLRAWSRDDVTWSASALDAQDLSGNLAISARGVPEDSAVNLTLSGAFDDDQATGHLLADVVVERRLEEGTVAGTAMALAQWQGRVP